MRTGADYPGENEVSRADSRLRILFPSFAEITVALEATN